jgi:hypothetical protein
VSVSAQRSLDGTTRDLLDAKDELREVSGKLLGSLEVLMNMRRDFLETAHHLTETIGSEGLASYLSDEEHVALEQAAAVMRGLAYAVVIGALDDALELMDSNA